jgi:CRP/FNR family transcriptional regulator
MATNQPTAEILSRYEDALAHLPMSKTTAYNKGQVIYDLDHHSRSIYLVVKGTVGISHIAEDGTEVLLEIVRADELFGESAFLDLPRRSERAQAIERAELMTWPVSEMEDLLTKRPRLAVALLQVIALRNAEYASRIESFAIDSIERRLARSLLRFSERLGIEEESGSVWMIPLTQDMLARYIGTSREVASHHMNRFRKRGFVTYSRRGISLHRETLRTVLD